MSASQIDAVALDGVGPLYDQIRRAIRDLILNGVWPPGTAVPPEHALMERLGASRMTVHRALVQLAREGLITRRRRSGTIVASPPASHAMLDILSIPEEVRGLGHAYALTVLQRRDGRALRPVVSLFELGRAVDVVHLSVLHWADGVPHVLEERVIHLATVPAAAQEDFSTMPPGDWLLQNSLWSQAEHAISAVAATAEQAELLAIAEGDPCLLVERRTWNQGEPVTAVRLLYPGGRHRFVGRFGPYGKV
ncbi:histidine utilization repressor [Bosea sp. (in: a-proteobacteria)]|uniref:histidine utilization repressor n=1 Tax=Bosea sp. (in: a-proteobacteria) TaxID=1871050 RepID=UPI0008692F09|nr:histidine utilization repressor [Bosea sp. (in: a-proteobacteria)]MBN9439958.1 histidine utilization repressor [Bosea sp. (in: a-proteobacteria)]ODT45463.1 MAG: histidine utilization repressor [Methylobacterium sp. SCN 67-24]